MNVETIATTEPKTFNLQGLTKFEIDLLQEGLIELKNNRLKDAEEFKAERRSCVEIYQAIDAVMTRKEQ